MNTRKQVLIMTTLLLLMLVTIAAYAAWYPSRAEDAAGEFAEATSERGAILFARNCRLCHGDVGQGGSLGARLPAAPALNTPRLQGFIPTNATLDEGISATTTTIKVNDVDVLVGGDVIMVDQERMEIEEISDNELTVKRGIEHSTAAQHFDDAPVFKFDKAAFDLLNPSSIINLISNTISCGRVGTAMPAWSQKYGGPLSDEQVRQLQTLIMAGRWDLVAEEVDLEDRITTHLTQPLDAETISMFVDDVTVFNGPTPATPGEAIRIGDERIRVTGVPALPKNLKGELPADKSGVIGIERGVLGTTPLEHAVEAELYRFPETPEPSINQASCGQTAQAPAPAGTPELIEDFTGQTVNVVAANIAFDLKEIRVNTGGQLRVRLDNKEAVRHNIAFYKSATDVTVVSPGSVGLTFEGPAVDDTVFDVPTTGSYFFRCDVHPTIMTGTFVVN
jgi:plastocyanin